MSDINHHSNPLNHEKWPPVALRTVAKQKPKSRKKPPKKVAGEATPKARVAALAATKKVISVTLAPSPVPPPPGSPPSTSSAADYDRYSSCQVDISLTTQHEAEGPRHSGHYRYRPLPGWRLLLGDQPFGLKWQLSLSAHTTVSAQEIVLMTRHSARIRPSVYSHSPSKGEEFRMSRENDKPNPLRHCPTCGTIFRVVKTRGVGPGVRRTKRCAFGHMLTTEEWPIPDLEGSSGCLAIAASATIQNQ